MSGYSLNDIMQKHSRVCVYIQCECYILNTHMYHLIAMNDLVHGLKKEWRKAPHSLQLTLFYGQTMTKKMNHNLLSVFVCVRV